MKFATQQNGYQLRDSAGNILYSIEKSDLFPNYRSVLTEALIRGINLDGLFVENENLDRIIFQQTALNGLTLKNCSIERAEFIKCEINGFHSINSNLKGIKIKHSKISNLHLDASDVTNSRFQSNSIPNAFLIDSNISDSEFHNCNIDSTAFHSCGIKNVKFENCSLCEVKFLNNQKDPNWMKDVQFNYCQLDDCDLSEMDDLSKLQIKESNIQNTISQNYRYTKVINNSTTVLYAIDSDVVWWDSFRGNLESFKHEIDNMSTIASLHPPDRDNVYYELSIVRDYLQLLKGSDRND